MPLLPTTNNLEEHIEAVIVGSPFINHRHVKTTMVDGNVRLEGRVETFFEKQMAQEAIRAVCGNGLIDNRLVVAE